MRMVSLEWLEDMAKKTSLNFTIALFATNLVVMQQKYLSSLQRNNTDVSFSFIATGCELAGTTKILYNEQNSY